MATTLRPWRPSTRAVHRRGQGADGTARRPPWWGEVLVVVWLCWVYDAVTNLAPLRRTAAYDHSRSILDLERRLHIDVEASLDHWLAQHHTVALLVANYYDNAHFVVTLGVVGWLWWRHPDHYRPLRSTLVLTNVIGFVIYWFYPTAPPRLLDPARYHDVVAATHAFGSWHSGTLAQHANELAAMPSLHISWAAWSALAVSRVFARHRWVRLVWIYPVLTTIAVLATGNHFVADCVAGLAVLGLAMLAAAGWAQALGRWRPPRPGTTAGRVDAGG
jgi:hypothetical protein